jgi:hypothetical protein
MSAGTRAAASLGELAPLVRRVATLDPATLVRIRAGRSSASALVRLPFGVLAGRTVRVADAAEALPVDRTYAAAELLAWLDGDGPGEPEGRDAQWRGGLPPRTGWRRVEQVPEDVVRELVRAGARALEEAASREGVPGAQPRAEVADALLDSIVLTVSDELAAVEVPLRLLSALTRLGFLLAGSEVNVDVAGRWFRVAATYGSVYSERPGSGLGML